LTYLWVGIGSAFGGIARYWISLAMTSLTGPGFPWGTILINVVGSFIIGFFGALTGIGGSLNVSGDLRVFVMVGICGGFTTFSSFSLQTLDLAHEGRWSYALANIVLSVTLCMIFVTLGHVSAAWMNISRSG
jgi:CrcB protein